ncbi:hypothetical protein RvY_18102 [Ramazzottius varieornatus]|uniref:Uncharacterized protein n=1 Tax=Ramazzottius varieornatus TaxID=947166 RepID=A0A1D1W4J2_RAMVA|nr:hypothetical protein RvY_18102 [Ramazzottius varieornatus]
MVDKSVEADVKKLRAVADVASNVGSQKKQFWQALEKLRVDGFASDDVYNGIKRYAEVKHRPDTLVQHKNRIVSLRRSGKVVVAQAKVFLRGSRGHFGVRTAVAYLLWNKDVLQFLAGIPLTLDEETKTDMYKKATDEILQWYKSVPAQKKEAATKKVEPEVQQKRKYNEQEIEDFCNTLAKARRDATITENVYQAIHRYSEKRHAHLWIAKFKNSILPGTKEGERTVKRLNKFSKSAQSMWPVSLAIVCLLWTGEMLKFAQDSELLLDEEAKTILYKGAEKAVLDWSVTNSRVL